MKEWQRGVGARSRLRHCQRTKNGTGKTNGNCIAWWMVLSMCPRQSEILNRFRQLMVETNLHGKTRMKAIHLVVQAAGIGLREGERYTRARRDIEVGQLVGYPPCDLYGESEHPGGSMRYRTRIEQIGNVFLDWQSFTNISVGHGECVSNLWFARTAHLLPNVSLRWEPVNSGSLDLLWMLVGRAPWASVRSRGESSYQ